MRQARVTELKAEARRHKPEYAIRAEKRGWSDSSLYPPDFGLQSDNLNQKGES
jgi:hypothetical protein